MTPITDPTAEISSGYLLIDTLNLPRSLGCDPLPMRVCVAPDLTNIMSLLPGVVDIESLNADQLLTVREIMELQTAGRHPWAICGVLTSDLNIEELAKHIASLLSVVDDEDRAVLWRFFDPRVFSLLLTIYSAEQKNALLGPIREWRFAWRGHWWLANGEGDSPDLLRSFDVAWPTKVQWPLLRLSKLLDQVLLRLESDAAIAACDCLDVQHRAVVFLKEAATEMNFSEPNEMIDYAFMCVRHGPAFLSHPQFKHAKADLASGELNWWTFKNLLDLRTLP
ncbi:DUF4123 domain-containing protein [Burkholderia sp. LMU1-1-1.1]|uniref:DUF4123 domain-containing protein n=1 Tax=Burkholderia sp. LMU1-1-1.1 TaxID=3135266 RepID=UPI0034173537